MKKLFKRSVWAVVLMSLGFSSSAFGGSVLIDAHSCGCGATTWNITTTKINELILISCGGYGTLTTTPGTVKVNGSNATYITEGLFANIFFSWTASVWAFVAPAIGTYTCTCTETNMDAPFYFNYAASVYETGSVLGLGNIIIGGNNNNQGFNTITASITTTQANAYVYGHVSYNDNGNFGTIAWNNGLIELDHNYIDDGIDGAHAGVTMAAAATYNITCTDLTASNPFCAICFIAVQPSGPLPVQLTNFECNSASNGIQLNWSTATETNSRNFTVERSVDGIQFDAIAELPAAGNSESAHTYTYVDDNPLPGTNYYRLTETDLDGKSQTFNTTQCSQNEGYNQVYPNPNNGNFTVSLAPSTSTQSVVIFDLTGREVFNQQFAPNANGANYSINLPQGKTGVFMAKILNGGQVVAVKKVVVY